MSDQCGPWTLEGLDSFGSIDSLAFSLDDPIWESPDTCILDGQGAISGQGNVSSSAIYIADAQSFITGIGFLSSDAFRQRDLSASITGVGEITVTAVGKERLVDLSFLGEGTLSATAGYIAETSGFISGVGSLSSTANYTVSAKGNISGALEINVSGYYYGEEWTVVPFEPNVWTEVSPN